MKKKKLLEFKSHVFYCLYFQVCSLGTEEPQILLWLWQMLPVLPPYASVFPLWYIPAYSPTPFTISLCPSLYPYALTTSVYPPHSSGLCRFSMGVHPGVPTPVFLFVYMYEGFL